MGWEGIKDFLSSDTGKAVTAIGGSLLGYFGGKGDSQSQGSQGYTGGIPELVAQRSLVPNAFDSTGRRPGEAGRRYFTSQAASDLYASPGLNTQGLPRLMGQQQLNYMAQQNQLADLQNQQTGLGLLSLLTGSTVEGLPDYFKNRAAGTTGGGTTGKGTTDSFANKVVEREGLGSLTLAPTAPAGYQPVFSSPGVVGTADIYEPAYIGLNQILAGKNTLAEQLEVFDRFGIADTTAAKYLGMQLSELVTARENIQNKRIADEAAAAKAKTDAFNEKYPEAPQNAKPYISPFTGKPLVNKDGAWRGTDGKYYRGNPPGFAGGGLASLGRGYYLGGSTSGMANKPARGYYLGGTTDGMADKVPATIDGREPARLSDGEFVIPADVVSHLGNGNSDAGAKNLYSMMDRVREARTGTTKQGTEINPQDYLV